MKQPTDHPVRVYSVIVSASDSQLAERLTHIALKIGDTSGVLKSSLDWLNYTGFPEDVCVAFFNVTPENNDAVMPNPLMEEESSHVYNCDDELLSGSTKRWIFKSMWKI